MPTIDIVVQLLDCKPETKQQHLCFLYRSLKLLTDDDQVTLQWFNSKGIIYCLVQFKI